MEPCLVMAKSKKSDADKEFDSLVAAMQTNRAKAAVRSLSTLTPGKFRKAAFQAANEKNSGRK